MDGPSPSYPVGIHCRVRRYLARYCWVFLKSVLTGDSTRRDATDVGVRFDCPRVPRAYSVKPHSKMGYAEDRRFLSTIPRWSRVFEVGGAISCPSWQSTRCGASQDYVHRLTARYRHATEYRELDKSLSINEVIVGDDSRRRCRRKRHETRMRSELSSKP